MKKLQKDDLKELEKIQKTEKKFDFNFNKETIEKYWTKNYQNISSLFNNYTNNSNHLANYKKMRLANLNNKIEEMNQCSEWDFKITY